MDHDVINLYDRLRKDHRNNGDNVRLRVTEDGWITNEFWAFPLDVQPRAFVKLFAEFNLAPEPGTYLLGRSLKRWGDEPILKISTMLQWKDPYVRAHLVNVADHPVVVDLPTGPAYIASAPGVGLVALTKTNYDLVVAHAYGDLEISETVRPVRWINEPAEEATAVVMPVRVSTWGDLGYLHDLLRQS